MAYSYAESTASGSTKVFTVPFEYIDKAYVHVSVNGVLVDDALLTWNSDTEVVLPTIPVAGATVRRFRTTPKTPLVTFQSGDLSTVDLNLFADQCAHVVQEALDSSSDVGQALATLSGTFSGYATAAAASAMDAASAASIASSKSNEAGAKAVEAGAKAAEAAASAILAATFDPAAYYLKTAFRPDGTPGAPVKFDADGAISPISISANFIKVSSVGKGTDAVARIDVDDGHTGAVSICRNGVYKFSLYLAPDGTFGAFNGAMGTWTWYTSPTTNVVNFAKSPVVDGNPITALSKPWESPEIALVQGGAFSVSHTLGVAPKLVQAFLVCKTAESGYSVGQIVPVPAFYQYNGGHDGLGLDLSSSTIIAGRFASAGLTFSGINPKSGASFNYTLANWRMILRAYA